MAVVVEHFLPRLCSCSGPPVIGFGLGFHRARGTAAVTVAVPRPEAADVCVPTVCLGVVRVVFPWKRYVVCPLKCHEWGMWHLATLQSVVYVRVNVTHLGGMEEGDDVERGCTTLDTARSPRLYRDTNHSRAWPDTSCSGG